MKYYLRLRPPPVPPFSVPLSVADPWSSVPFFQITFQAGQFSDRPYSIFAPLFVWLNKKNSYTGNEKSHVCLSTKSDKRLFLERTRNQSKTQNLFYQTTVTHQYHHHPYWPYLLMFSPPSMLSVTLPDIFWLLLRQ